MIKRDEGLILATNELII